MTAEARQTFTVTRTTGMEGEQETIVATRTAVTDRGEYTITATQVNNVLVRVPEECD